MHIKGSLVVENHLVWWLLRKQINICRRKIDGEVEPIAKNESTESENASSEIPDTYEKYGHDNSYAQYKSDESYEMYIEKYQNYDHFVKFQKGEMSSESSDSQ